MLKSNITELKAVVKKVRRGPDLSEELKGKNQSGGRIVISKDVNGKIKVSRQENPKLAEAEEMAQREEVFQLFKKLNVIKAGQLYRNDEAPNEKIMSVLHQFALSDVGAVWLRYVTDDTIANINRGYLEVDASKNNISSLVTGNLTEDANYDPEFIIFSMNAKSGYGAHAEASAISLGQDGFQDAFPSTGQKIDPLAIISHEFGHTRYGDPTTSENLHGEARCVEHFENPARVHHHYDERLTYCDPKTNMNIHVKTRVITPMVCNPK